MGIRRVVYLAGSLVLLLAFWFVLSASASSMPARNSALAAPAMHQDAGSIRASIPLTTPTLPPPPNDPEYLVLQYVAANHSSWNCGSITGTPGHRTLNACHPYDNFSHPTDGHLDRYASPQESYNQWTALNNYAIQHYPHHNDGVLACCNGYEASDDNYPYAHSESYYYYLPQNWVFGAVSSDDTIYRGAWPMSLAIETAAEDLGYITTGSVTPTVTATPSPTVEPEYAILQYVSNTHPAWQCFPITGSPGHRELPSCDLGYNQHYTNGYIDNYGSPGAAEAAWETRRTNAQQYYPNFMDTSYANYPGYNAWDNNTGSHTESYYWGSVWNMGATSLDYTTNFRGAPAMAQAIIGAAMALGYLGSPTPTPTPIGTPTCTPAGWAYLPFYPEPIVEPAVAALGGHLYSTGGRISGPPVADTFDYNIAMQTWSVRAPQPQPRHGSSALTIGSQIYVLNGQDSYGNGTNSLYIYDPASNSWSAGPNLQVLTWGQAAVLLNNNIYRIVGCTNQDCTGTTNTVERGGQLVANYPMSLGWPMAVTLNGDIYVAGGTVGTAGPGITKTYRYDPNTDTWDDNAVADLPEPRWGAASGVVNGKWVVAGGYSGTGVLNTAIEWDPATNTWSSIANMLAGRGEPGSVVANNVLYAVGGSPAIGGYQSTIEVQRYDPGNCGTTTPTVTATPTVCPSAGWGYGSSYSEPIMEEAMAARGGLLYATGGRSSGATVADTFVYDPISQNWSTLAPQPEARHGSSAINVGSLIYVLNGENSSGNATNTVYSFDPMSNSWSVAGNTLVSTWGQAAVLLNNNIYRIAGCVSQDCTTTTNTVERGGQLVASYPDSTGWPMAVALNGFIYVGGGTTGIGGPGTSKTYRYDPNTDTWDDNAIADLPEPRWGAVSGVVNGKWVVAGGYSLSSVLNTAIEWDPATNTWSPIPNMIAGRGQPGSAVVNGILYVAGGSPARGAFQGSIEVQQYNPGGCATPGPTSTTIATATVTPPGSTTTPTSTPPGNTVTASPTSTGTPPVLCDVFYPAITSTCQPPSTYGYDFSAYVYCPYGIEASGTLEFDVAPSSSGPWTDWSQHPISGILNPFAAHITGTFTESGIPSQYIWYRLIASVHTSNGQWLTANSLPALLCGAPTPTATAATGTPIVTSTPGTPQPTVTACPIQFTDVPPGSTFYDPIRCLACRGIMSGYADGTFRPNANVTRGQLSKIVSNSAGWNDEIPPDRQTFEDVSPGSTFWLYVERMAAHSALGGYACGEPGEPCVPPGNRPYFRPNANVSRGQTAKIVSNAAGYQGQPTGQTFQDVDSTNPFYLFVERLVSREVMGGYPCGGVGEPCVPPGNKPYFRPYNTITRGQSSKIVANTFFPGCVTP